MKKALFALIIAIGVAGTAHATAGDTTWVQANKVQLDNYNNFDTTVAFPDGSKTYRKIYMIFTLGKYVCPGTPMYCGDWDYTVQTYFMAKHASDTLELGRFMTPYAHTGSGPFTAGWTNRYIFDVTDYYPALKDSGTVRIHYSGYSGGFTGNVKFAFIEGTPERPVLKVERLWHGDYNYGHGATNINAALGTLSRIAPAGTASAEVKMNITGHGGDDNGCAEFCPNRYQLDLNGSQLVQQSFFRADCSDNDLYPQSGTWIYARANWCPGALVKTITHKLPGITGGGYNLAMTFPAYTSTTLTPNTFAASYTIDATAVYYGVATKGLDASLDDIIAPTDAEYHWRQNPTTGSPVFTVRNTGNAAITSIKFQYGVTGYSVQTYTWTGNIASLQTTEIAMPVLADLKRSPGIYGFKAQILQVNGTSDGDSTNNKLASTFTAAATWPTDVRVQLKSNNEASPTNSAVGQTAWRIEDMSGNIVKKKADCPLGTVCEDTVHLQNNTAYRIVVTDTIVYGFYDITTGGAVGVAQGNGLSGFSSPVGSFRVYNLSDGFPITIPGNYNGNFGGGFTQYFYVGSPNAVSSVKATDAKLTVFPNPATDAVYVVVDGMQHSAGRIDVIDMYGRIVLTKPYSYGITDIKANGLANGIYQLIYTSDNGQNVRLQQRLTLKR